jgi:hypothetical protein
LGGFIGWRYLHRGARVPLAHREIATRVLAEYARTNLPVTKVLVISNPFSTMSGKPPEVYAFEKAGIEGLRTGFGDKTEIKVKYPHLKPAAVSNPQSIDIDPGTKTPLSFLVAENSFDELCGENKDCELAISLIGVPLNLTSSAVWKSVAPRFALLLPDWRMIGGAAEIRRAFESGKLVAAVVSKPGGVAEDQAATGDYRSEFRMRFILITKSNVNAVLAENPQVFE